MRLVPTFAGEPEHDYLFEIGGEAVRIRFVYRSRLQSWYFDLETPSGERIVSGRRVSPLRAPLLGLGLPFAEVMTVQGSEPYTQESLGEAVRIFLEDPPEVPPVSPGFNVRGPE